MSSQHETTCSAPPDRSATDAEPVQGVSNELQELRLAPNSQKEAADSHADVRPEAPPRQVSSSPSTPPRPTAFKVPVQLIKPGLELLKVSAKSARRVKPRKVWLETMSDKDRDGGKFGLELDLGGVSKQEVKLCWEKNGAGLGKLPPKPASPACPFFRSSHTDDRSSQASDALPTTRQCPCRAFAICVSVRPGRRTGSRCICRPPSSLAG